MVDNSITLNYVLSVSSSLSHCADRCFKRLYDKRITKMSAKRKRVVLSLKDKVEIINQLKKGVAGKVLADRFGVGAATITDIKNNSEKILSLVTTLETGDGCSSRKVMKKAKDEQHENAVFTWFLQQRSIGQPISGPILCEKARMFSEKMGVGFKASTGWIRNFKNRHGIRELDIAGEKLSADSEAANKFVDTFKKETENYDPDLVYNADETGLNWKALPRKTLASKREQSAPGHKVSKDRVTIMVCANSTGTHRLPLLLIGKAKKPRAFKNVAKLPVTYTNQKSAWMDSSIFLEWYDKTFIPETKKVKKETGKKGKVLLIIDNAPTHPSLELLVREKGKFKCLFLPPNVTSLLQPMDQGVIECTKRLYRQQLLRKLLLAEENDEERVLDSYKKINLKDCCYMIADSWNMVKSVSLKRAWNKINGTSTKEQLELEKQAKERESTAEVNEDEQELPSVEEFVNMANEIAGCSECDVADMEEWLHCDKNDQGFQIQTDDEIAASAMDEQDNEEDDNETEGEEAQDQSVPSHSEAFMCFDNALKWMERQPECDGVQLLAVRRLRDLAARKRASTSRQLTLIEMFK